MEQLARNVIQQARQNKLSLITVESCTGGLIAHTITKISGASDVFWAGLVTYHNDVKQQVVHVPHHILENEGAVSKQCAFHMIQGGLQITGAQLGVAVTGIAGPAGGSNEKPVGTTYWGIGLGNDIAVYHAQLPFEKREVNQYAATYIALNLLQYSMENQLPAQFMYDQQVTINRV